MTDSQQLTRFKEVQQQFEVRTPEFQRMLPAHIPAQRFMRVSLIAIQTNPKLLLVPQGALFRALMQCAQDGLLPDGREAALVTYKSREGGVIVSYQPMIAGIRKKAWNSGELASWEAYLVHQNDHFEIVLGSDSRIEHRPVLRDRGAIIAVYSIAKFKNGATSMDWMALEEVTAIRQRSRAADSGPWVTDFGEMVKKTMLRRHSKALPLSSELDELIRREDDLHDLPQPQMVPIDLHADEPQEEDRPKRRGRPPKLSDFRQNKNSSQQEPAASPAGATAADDSRSGEASSAPQNETRQSGAPGDGPIFKDLSGAPSEADALSRELNLAHEAEKAGYDAYFDGKHLFPVPKQYHGVQAAKDAYRRGWEQGRAEDTAGDDQDTRSVE